MKKRVLMSLLVAVFLLSGCNFLKLPDKLDGDNTGKVELFTEINSDDNSGEGTVKTSEEDDKPGTVDLSGVDKQLDIYADYYDVWKFDDDVISEGACSYGLIDFDGDGVLELVTTTMQGSGNFSYTNIYSIDPQTGELDKISLEDGTSPDFIDNYYFVFYEDNGHRYFVTEDQTVSAGEVSVVKESFSVYQGNADVVELAYYSAFAGTDNENYLYTNYNDLEITETEYRMAADYEYGADCEKYMAEVMWIGANWITDADSVKEELMYAAQYYHEQSFSEVPSTGLIGKWEMKSLEVDGCEYKCPDDGIWAELYFDESLAMDFHMDSNGNLTQINNVYPEFMDGKVYSISENTCWHAYYEEGDVEYFIAYLPDDRVEMLIYSYFSEDEYPVVTYSIFERK